MGKTSPVYVVRLTPRPGVDGIKALRAALKLLGRRFGLWAVKIETVPDDEPNLPMSQPLERGRKEWKR
jgi:hypothetical protein